MTLLLSLPQRAPLGPDPSNVHPRVFKALSARVVGLLNTEFFKVMEENKQMLNISDSYRKYLVCLRTLLDKI